jgi:hypothetical protein
MDRLRSLFQRASSHTDDVAEHQAVVDLLVLAVYADHTVGQLELAALETFEDHAQDWDEGGFSVHQYLPVSIAKARDALDVEGGVTSLMAVAASQITTPVLRAEAVAYCEMITQVDGTVTTAENEFLAALHRMLS